VSAIDAQRQSHHLGMDVDDLAVVATIEHVAGQGHHRTVVSKKLPAGEDSAARRRSDSPSGPKFQVLAISHRPRT
jgi:hypothetical protein